MAVTIWNKKEKISSRISELSQTSTKQKSRKNEGEHNRIGQESSTTQPRF